MAGRFGSISALRTACLSYPRGMSLFVCAECARHHRESSSCPFCGASVHEPRVPRAAAAFGSRAAFLVGSVALAAGCQSVAPSPAYGGPPPDLKSPPAVAVPSEADAAATPSGPPTAPPASASGTASAEKPPAKPAPKVPVGPVPAYGAPPPRQ